MFLQVFIVTCAFMIVSDALYEGDFCKTVRGRKGRCRNIRECKSALQDLDKGVKPKVCSFSKSDPIVCCNLQTSSHSSPIKTSSNKINTPIANIRRPEERPVGLKTQEKCDEYVQYFRSMTLPPGVKNAISYYCISPYVLGGLHAAPREFLHMAQIGYESHHRGIVWKCGGSLISRRFVLTAAHCAEVMGVPAKWVRLGDYKKNSDEDEKSLQAEAVNVAIQELIVHPDYRSPLINSDIALCRLATDVTITPFILPVCLDTGEDLETNWIIWATGWGHTEFGGCMPYGGRKSTRVGVPFTIGSKDPLQPFKCWGGGEMLEMVERLLGGFRGRGSNILLKVELTHKKIDECRIDYPPNPETRPRGIIDTMMCTHGVNRDTCQEDSGGPLHTITRRNDSEGHFFCLYTQVGIISAGKSCGTLSGINTRVSSFIGWIENVVWPEYNLTSKP